MKKILVTGDHSIDYNIYLPTTEINPPAGTPPAKFRPAVGGAGIVYRLLKQIAQTGMSGAQFRFEVGFARCQDSNDILASPIAAIWHPQTLDALGGDEKSKKAKVWRLTRSVSLRLATGLPVPRGVEPPRDAGPEFSPDILVLEDDAVEFRFDRTSPLSSTKPVKKTVPGGRYASLMKHQGSRPRWIIHKMTAPLSHGDLWWYLTRPSGPQNRLIVVLSVSDLRLKSVRISKDISWERTAQDLVQELYCNPELSALRSAAHVIVTFHGDGALWMERVGRKQPKFHLLFDPQYMEGEWSDAMASQGEAYGFLSCFTASLAAHLAKAGADTAEERFVSGIRHGLWVMRLLRGLGHGFVESEHPGLPVHDLAEVVLADKLKPVFAKYEETTRRTKGKNPLFDFRRLGPIGWTEIPSEDAASANSSWRILENVDATLVRPEEEPLYAVGRRVAFLGVRHLGEIPHARFGKLITIDRDEIESLRNLKCLIQDYHAHTDQQKPLSLAVFGPPGAGKSFAIKQIAEQLLGEKNPCLEFNLSQFKDENDLIGAFHQVRDKVLEGHLPVIFWDEFDSQRYKWLQYLLAPMQDAKFQEGQLTHPIGRCIFVFAGATSYDLENFGPREDDRSTEGKRTWQDFNLKKGPDFKSRLHGYLNVLGPNPRQRFIPSAPQGKQWVNDPGDVCFPVRRAVLLRSMLGYVGKREDERMEMDSGLMAALLETSGYTHGARSMEKILTGLNGSGKQRLRRSNLPTDEILMMNVESLPEFKSIMGRAHRFQEYARRLGPAIHRAWQLTAKKNNPNKITFAKLSGEAKADNYAAAMRIPILLELVGLYPVPKRSPEKAAPATAVKKLLKKHVELLAEEEHNHWMQFRLESGWRLGNTNDPIAKTHSCLIPYADLSKEDQDRDRRSVSMFPKMVALAKFKLIARKPSTED